jgi:hypothetical protein
MTHPRLERFTDAYIEPYVFGDDRMFRGGIDRGLRSSLGRLRWGKHTRDLPPDRPADAASAPRLAGRHLYAGPIWHHFGHVMVDSLHLLWALGDHERIVFLGVVGLAACKTPEQLASWTLPTFAKDILLAIDIDPERAFIIRRPTVVEELEVPEPGAVWQDGVRPFYLEHLRRYRKTIEAKTARVTVPDRIYYSRLHLLEYGGGVLGSSFFERRLAENGFAIVRPETLPIVQQFAHLLKAKQIIFDEGSAIHLTELLDVVPPALYMLPRRRVDVVYDVALSPRGRFLPLSAGENVNLLPDSRGNSGVTGELTFYSDPEQVFDRMAQQGLVRGRFDKQQYFAAEMSDLLGCRAATPDIRDRRIASLKAARASTRTVRNMTFSRASVIQGILNLFPDPTYLEIGVYSGATFSQVTATRKTAVDPHFRFNVSEWSGRMKNAAFCAMTSDVFFQDCTETYDVIFLDGLHTFEQTLRDFCNATCHLREGGVIVVDDVIPSSYYASLPNLEEHMKMRAIRRDNDNDWMGDVYRLVFFVETFFQHYSYATVAENHGQAVFWAEPRNAIQIPQRTVSSIATLPYERVHLDRGSYRIQEFTRILEHIKSARSALRSTRRKQMVASG